MPATTMLLPMKTCGDRQAVSCIAIGSWNIPKPRGAPSRALTPRKTHARNGRHRSCRSERWQEPEDRRCDGQAEEEERTFHESPEIRAARVGFEVAQVHPGSRSHRATGQKR